MIYSTIIFRVSILFLLMSWQVSFAQTDARDSLQHVIDSNADVVEKGRAHQELAQSYLSAYDLENAETHGQKSLKIFQKEKVDSMTQLSYKLLGVVAIYQGKTDLSLELMHHSNRIAHTLNDSTVLAKNYGIISNIYNQFLNEPDQAFIYIDSAEMYFQEDQIRERVFGKIVKGSIFVNVSSYHLAIKEFYAGLDLVENDSSLITSLHNNIGTVFKATGDYTAARENFEQAIRFSKGDLRSLGIAHHNMALVYNLEEQQEKAIEEEKKAIAYLKQLGINTYLFQAQLTAGQLYHEQNQQENAFELFASIDTSGLIPQERLLWYTLGAMIEYPGFTFGKLDKDFQAQRTQCVDDVLMDVAQHIYKHYKGVGNVERALYYKEVYSDLKDSLLAHNKIVEVQRINLSRIVDQKNEELEQERADALLAENALLLEEERGKRWMYFFLFIVVLILSAFVLIYQRYTAKKKLALRQQDQLTRERQQRQLLINRLDETRTQLAASLEPKPDSSETLMEQLNDRNWPNFLTEFELVYPGFFQRLDALTIDHLSKNERRLCCLIKLNLSNKEIAEYVFVSPESVKKAKNRLFKKFDLSNSESMISDIIRNL